MLLLNELDLLLERAGPGGTPHTALCFFCSFDFLMFFIERVSGAQKAVMRITKTQNKEPMK